MKYQARAAQRMLDRARPVRMTLQARINPPRHGEVLLAAAIGPAGEALTLWGPAALDSKLHSRTGDGDVPSFPITETAAPWTARLVVTHLDNSADIIEVGDLTTAFPMFQPLPGGTILIIGPRCEYTADGPQPNAIVIGPNGTTLRTGVLGDGIEDARTTPDGRIIVSYFDEGVFGNCGWGGPDGPTPIGHPGLVEFDADLHQVWSYPVDDDTVPVISDCYAINVVNETIWACYYTDFPLVRIQDGKITLWHNELAAGAHHLLVHDSTVAFVGGYDHSDDFLTIAELKDGRTTALDTRRIDAEWASPVRDILHTSAHGSKLHRVTTDGHWYTLDLADGQR